MARIFLTGRRMRTVTDGGHGLREAAEPGGGVLRKSGLTSQDARGCPSGPDMGVCMPDPDVTLAARATDLALRKLRTEFERIGRTRVPCTLPS